MPVTVTSTRANKRLDVKNVTTTAAINVWDQYTLPAWVRTVQIVNTSGVEMRVGFDQTGTWAGAGTEDAVVLPASTPEASITLPLAPVHAVEPISPVFSASVAAGAGANFKVILGG